MSLVDDSSINAEALKEFELRNASHFFTVGYTTKYSKSTYAAIKVFNVVLAVLLCFCSLPVGVLIAIIIRKKDGGPIFYKGARLGINKKIFFMYKFRTLPFGAQEKIGAKLLTQTNFKVSTFSRFLRDTRLDELPQLINILKGDMDFIGPRPVRPEIYEKLCRNINHYDNRFYVRPGLIGYSQLFSPHSAPKRIRSMIDNLMIVQDRKITWDLFIIIYTIMTVVEAILVKGVKLTIKLYNVNIKKAYTEKRYQERIDLNGLVVSLQASSGTEFCMMDSKIININDNYFRVFSNDKLDQNKYQFKLTAKKKGKNKTKLKHAVCTGEVFRSNILKNDPAFRFEYVIQYKAVSPFNQYIIDAYFLNKSMA